MEKSLSTSEWTAIWYLPPLDLLVILPERPAAGFENFPHDVSIKDEVVIEGAHYVGEL